MRPRAAWHPRTRRAPFYQRAKEIPMTLLRAALGAFCGFAATGPMTVVMLLLHRCLPARERYALPPEQITAKAVDAAGAGDEIDAPAFSVLILLAHFAYGAGAGALYGAAEPKLPGGPAARGATFGMVVWGVSYLGLLPGLGILSSAKDHPARRSALMIAAHLVWGWVLAAMFASFFSALEDPAVQRRRTER